MSTRAFFCPELAHCVFLIFLLLSGRTKACAGSLLGSSALEHALGVFGTAELAGVGGVSACDTTGSLVTFTRVTLVFRAIVGADG